MVTDTNGATVYSGYSGCSDIVMALLEHLEIEYDCVEVEDEVFEETFG